MHRVIAPRAFSGIGDMRGAPWPKYATPLLLCIVTTAALLLAFAHATAALLTFWAANALLLGLVARSRSRWTQLTQRYDDLAQRNARIEELIALEEALTAALPSRRDVIDLILQFAKNRTGALGTALDRVSEDDVVCEAATGILVSTIGTSMARGDSLSGLCSVSNDVMHCRDASNDPRVDATACEHYGIRSVVAVPLAFDGTVTNVLKIVSDRCDAFDERDILDLALAAKHLSSAMRAASSYERMELAEAEAQATIESLIDAVVVFSADGAVLRFNTAAERVLGLTKRQLQTWATGERSLVDVEEREIECADRPVAVALRTGLPQGARIVGFGASGVDRRWLMTTVRVVDATSAPGAGRFILSARDVTDLQQSEMQQRDYARQLSSLHLIASQVTHSGREQIDAALTLCREELGLDWGYLGVVNEDATELVIERSVGIDDEPSAQPLGARLPVERTLIGRHLASSEVIAVPDYSAVNSDFVMNGRWGAYIAVPIRVSDRVYGAIGFAGRRPRAGDFLASERDFVRITADLIASAIERRQQRERLDALAYIDALTGLPNRLVFEERLGRAVLAAKRHDEHFAVLYIDLDGFKAVNDRYGHGAGDEVLRLVARRLEAVVRDCDTAARIGGDEFLVLATKVRCRSEASDLAWRIVTVMRAPMELGGIAHTLSASVGVSFYPDDADDAEQMVQRADAALYRAKVSGKNGVGLASSIAPVRTG